MPDNEMRVDWSDLPTAVASEIEYIRALSSNKNLLLATSNRGAYEALLHIIKAGRTGVPVYRAISSVASSPSSQSGILLRLRAMRTAGIIDEVVGSKKSNVNLVASDEIVDALHPILIRRLSNQ
jgi:hypothetical protein